VSQNASTVNVLVGKSSRWLSGESMADSISPTGAQNLSPGVAPPAGVDGSAERCRRCPPPVTTGALAPDDRSAAGAGQLRTLALPCRAAGSSALRSSISAGRQRNHDRLRLQVLRNRAPAVSGSADGEDSLAAPCG
jgi:hypothetical protein